MVERRGVEAREKGRFSRILEGALGGISLFYSKGTLKILFTSGVGKQEDIMP
jgi:hypothetical protein